MAKKALTDLIEFQTWLVEKNAFLPRSAHTYSSQVRTVLRQAQITPDGIKEYFDTLYATGLSTGPVIATAWRKFCEWAATKGVSLPVYCRSVVPETRNRLPDSVCAAICEMTKRGHSIESLAETCWDDIEDRVASMPEVEVFDPLRNGWGTFIQRTTIQALQEYSPNHTPEDPLVAKEPNSHDALELRYLRSDVRAYRRMKGLDRSKRVGQSHTCALTPLKEE